MITEIHQYQRPPTMFGFHVSIGPRNGFGDFLTNCAAAGRAVGGTKCFKDGGGLETTAASKLSYVVWRTDAQYRFPNGSWDDYSDNPPYDYTWPTDQSETIARGWMEGCWKIWQYNPAHFYELMNEPNPTTELQMTNLIAFSRECMRLANEQYHVKLAVGGFSSGTPTEEFIERMSPLLDAMAQGGHILALHDGAATPEYVLFQDAYHEGSALRWRKWADIQAAQNRLMPFVYSTETYCPEFYREYGKSARQQDMLWYLQECAKDPYLLGTAMFELGEYNFGGGSVNLERAIPTLQEIVMQLAPIEPEPPTVVGVYIDVPFLSQNNPVSANETTSDCGPACLAMLLNRKGVDVTVNAVFRMTGAAPGQSITFSQMQRAANAFGFTLEDRRNQSLDSLRALLRSGNPPILLVNANYLNQPGRAIPYTGPHFILAMGYLSDGTIQAHDPNNLPATIQPGLDAAWGNCHEQGNPDYAMLVLIDGTTPPPLPVTDVKLGIGMGNLSVPTTTEINAIYTARLDAVKVLSLPDPDDNRAMIDALRRSLGNIHIMARLMFSPDPENHTRFSPAQFVDYVQGAAQALYEKGIREFEVHNEPNLQVEGSGWNWFGGLEFSNWFIEVTRLLRAILPEAQFGFPGLSPGDGMTGIRQEAGSFWKEAGAALNSADFVCLHSYWYYPGQTYWGMDDLTGGMSWKPCPVPSGKRRVITEFSNNNKDVTARTKGEQYVQYLGLLQQTGLIDAAYAFVLSWAYDQNREAWVVGNMVTDIPVVVGAR